MILIVVAAVMAVTLATLLSSSTQSGALHIGSAQSLYAAEAGLERALYGFTKEGAGCTSLAYNGTISVGGVSANFTTTGTAYAPAATTLVANITSSATMIPVADVGSYATHGRITIESESINYTGKSTDTTVCGGASACFTGASRGVGGTTAAAHNSGVAVAQNQCVIRSTGTSANTQRIVERATSPSVGGGGAMIVYAKANGNGVPYYRLWSQSTGTWGAEATANNVGANINWLVLKFARTRNEAILGSMNSVGEIRVQIWNGTTQTWGAPTLLATVTANNDFLYRGFDIDYETATDRAVIVYNNNVNGQFAFRTWDGTTLSGQTTVNIPLGAKPRWIETAANPNSASNELAIIMLDRNNDVYGMRWTGAAWSNMGTGAIWDNDVASATFRPIGVAWESLSGRALFVWGSNTSGRIYHRVWTGAVLNASQFRNVAAITSDVTWLRVIRDPFSNQIMSGVMDGGRDLNTAMWSGPPGDTWTNHPEHDNNTEDGNDRNFDIVFESSAARAGQAWLMWGGRVGGTRITKRRQWNGSAWGTITDFGDRAALVQLARQDGSGNLFAGVYRDSGASNLFITALQSPGGGPAWSAETTVWGGPVVGNPVKERVTVAADRMGTLVQYDWFEIFP